MFKKLETYFKRKRRSNNVFLKLFFSILSFFWDAVKFFTERSYRSVILLSFHDRENVHQTTNRTYLDRYPRIFKACQDSFANRDGLRVLSFGCSTGEEVLTLRHYFPSAFLVGVDINPWNLKECRKKVKEGNTVFILPDSNLIEKYGPYDIIFCMAVLQRTPYAVRDNGITDLKKLYPFEKFDNQLSELDSVMKEKGLMVLHNSHYLFSESRIGTHYQELTGFSYEKELIPIKFDKNSKLMETPQQYGSIFRKISSDTLVP